MPPPLFFSIDAAETFFTYGIRPILLAQARPRCLGWLKRRNDEKGGISSKGTLAKKGGNSRPHLLLLLLLLVLLP